MCRGRERRGGSWEYSGHAFTGGELMLEDEYGDSHMSLDDGSVLSATMIGTKGEWICFDATKYHSVLLSEGKRLSVALFLCKGLHRLAEADWLNLESLGFDVETLRSVAERQLSEDQKLGAQPHVTKGGPARRSASSTGRFASVIGAAVADARQSDRGKKRKKRLVHYVEEQVTSPYFWELPSQFRLFLRRVSTALGQGIAGPSPSVHPAGETSNAGLAPSLFPCGCPFPEAFRALAVPTSARRRQRWQKLRRMRIWTNHVVLYLTWMSLGQPKGGQAILLA
eukprot:5141644-Amphidinium_carterae.1